MGTLDAAAEMRVVRQNRADADEHGLILLSQFPSQGACARVGNPFGILTGGRYLSVKRCRYLDGNKGKSSGHELEIGFVRELGFRGADLSPNSKTRPPQPGRWVRASLSVRW